MLMYPDSASLGPCVGILVLTTPETPVTKMQKIPYSLATWQRYPDLAGSTAIAIAIARTIEVNNDQKSSRRLQSAIGKRKELRRPVQIESRRSKTPEASRVLQAQRLEGATNSM